MGTGSRSSTSGLIEFIDQIRSNRPDILEKDLTSIKDFIKDSGCKHIRFETLSDRAMGISKTNECVVSWKLLELPIEYLIYILLHEVSHQYQYKKWGKNFMLGPYLKEMNLDEAAEFLLWAEKIADRLSILKTKEILGSDIDIVPRYLRVNDLTQIKKYLIEIREEVKESSLNSIEEINDLIHNKIKS
jgi:hypothetical protein